MNRADLQQLATTRLAEAKALLDAGYPSGAYYLAGYALECAFKARIASFTKVDDFPDKRKVFEAYTHSLRELLKAAKLVAEFQQQLAIDAAFAAFWLSALNWDEESRYRMTSTLEAREMISAVENAHHGVLQWIKRYW